MNQQYTRGTISSIVATLIANGINIYLTNYVTKSYKSQTRTVVSFLTLFVFGNIISYCFDIMFAKSTFDLVDVPYSDYSTRLIWLLKSFFTIQFIKFMLTVILDIIIIYTVFEHLQKLMNKYDINFVYRDGIIVSLLSLITFFLYVNLLRFHWAYNTDVHPWMDVTIYAWISICLLIFLSKK